MEKTSHQWSSNLDTLAGSRISAVCRHTGSPSHPVDGYRSQRRLKHHTTRTNYPLLSIAFGQLIAGPLSDRLGRKPCSLVAQSPIVRQVLERRSLTNRGNIFFRVIQGFGAAAAVAMSRSIVVDFYGRDRAASVMSTIIAMMAIIPVFGTALGGVLTDFVGWQGSFWMLA